MRWYNAFLAIIWFTSALGPLLRSHNARSRSTQRPDMSNITSDSHQDGDGEKGRYLAALLNFLCADDPNEANRQYLRLHRKLAGYFSLRGMSDPDSDAHDVLDRAGEKIAKGHAIPDIDRFCIGIARNIVLERLRHRKREQTAFIKFIANSTDNNTEAMVDRITNLMKPCFEQLPRDDQNVLTDYCQVPPGMDRAEHRRQLAKKLGSTISALRIRVTRLRRVLADCVKALSKKR